MLWIKTRRCLRAIPHIWLTRFFEPIFNSSQVLTFATACIGLYLALAVGPTGPERDALASQWALAIQAFGLALTGWAIISLACAPFIAVFNDRRLGTFHDRRFVFREPYLAATIRCKATGQPQFHKFKFDSAEPGSFVHYRIDVQGNPPKHLYSATITSSESCLLVNRDTEPGSGTSQGGLRIGKDRSAELLIIMKAEMVSQTVRIYALDFSVGDDLGDTDGHEGEFRGAFRRPT